MSRILVIEDNEMNRWLMRDVLVHGSHEVICAVGVETARARLGEATPDLVLTDLRMADGSGEDLLAEIRGDPALAFVPVVVVTASAMAGDRERLMALGFDGYVSKPINVRSILCDVEAFLRLGERRRIGAGRALGTPPAA